MLYTVFIAICLAGISPRECSRHNAVDWVAAPEHVEGLGMCAIYGQQYAADTSLVKLGETYPKVYCSPGTGIGKEDADHVG
jgi:hypothetical protein